MLHTDCIVPFLKYAIKYQLPIRYQYIWTFLKDTTNQIANCNVNKGYYCTCIYYIISKQSFVQLFLSVVLHTDCIAPFLKYAIKYQHFTLCFILYPFIHILKRCNTIHICNTTEENSCTKPTFKDYVIVSCTIPMFKDYVIVC